MYLLNKINWICFPAENKALLFMYLTPKSILRPSVICYRQTLLLGCPYETIGFRLSFRKHLPRFSLLLLLYSILAHIMSGDYEAVDECDGNFDPDPETSDDFNLNPWWVKSVYYLSD